MLAERASLEYVPSAADARTKKILLLKKLFAAKSKDLKIGYVEAQEKRFLEMSEKSICDRKLLLRDMGLGVESAKVIA